ncbi:MAG: TRAP transporter small permease [Oscillospiraceae bacterium]|nr:TRAP transporter small permease [Oscillospiraceae bacterium]
MNKRTLKALGNLDVGASGVIVIALILLTFVNVIMRYILKSPITWCEELQTLFFMWIIFLTAGYAFRTGGHIAIEIVVDSLPKKIGGFIEKLDVLIQLVLLGYLSWQGIIYYQQMVDTNRVTTLLRIPYSLAYFVVPLGCALMFVSVIFTAIKNWREERTNGGDMV